MDIFSPAVIGVAAGIINTLGLVPYVRDIFRRKTKPERATWWIYSVLFTVLFAAQLEAGASWLLIVTAAYILSAIVIAVLSLKYGYGRLHKRDGYSLGIAALGILLWFLTSSPLVAVIAVIVVDAAGLWLTLVKTWKAPHSETLIAWMAALVAAILSLFTIDSTSLAIIIYPIYAVVGIGALVGLIVYRRPKVKEDTVDF